MLNYTIFPSAPRARLLDDRMRTQLRESFEVLSDCFDPKTFPEVAALNRFIAKLRQGHQPSPIDYGRHYELASATMAEDVSAARAILSAFATEQEGDRPVLTRWSDPAESLLQKVAAGRFGSVATLFHPVAPQMFETFRSRLTAGLEFLRQCWPEMADEISVLVKQVLVATGSSNATEHFDGGSHYQLWGLLVLNPAFHRSPLAIAEVLVHEASHILLFGFTTDEPLVLNPESELFPSPLRRDPRPMDGIYHAAFVSARMALTMDRVASAPFLSEDIRDEARRLRDEDIENFQKGAALVRAAANMTDTGLAIFADAETAVRDLVETIAVGSQNG